MGLIPLLLLKAPVNYIVNENAHDAEVLLEDSEDLLHWRQHDFQRNNVENATAFVATNG